MKNPKLRSVPPKLKCHFEWSHLGTVPIESKKHIWLQRRSFSNKEDMEVKSKPGRQQIASDPVSVNKPTPLQGQGA